MSANVILKQILLKRGNSAVSSTYVGPLGEITLDTTFKTIRIHDGITPGGNLIAQGAQGPAGPAGSPGGATGPQGNIGSTGATGLHVTSANVTVGNLLITLSNSHVINAGLVTGATGPSANIAIYDEGNLVIGAVASINFVGAIVTADTVGANVNVTIVGNNVPLSSDRLVSGNAQVVLNTSGPEPYVLFPAASDGQQLQLSQAELSSVSGNLALTSAEDALIIANGSGAVPGGSRLWRFDRTGSITLPNNAVIKDTATNSISFGLRAGDSGQGTLTVAIGSQAGEINQGLQSTAVGSGAGNYNQGIGTVAIGTNAGAFNQGLRAVAIGGLAGSQNQGEYAVALGNFAGGTNQPNNSIIINASGTALNGSASGLFIDPVREIVGTKIVYYNSSTKEITTGPIGLTSNSNVSITSNNNVWTFGTDGGLRTPDNQLTIGGYTVQASNNNEIDLSNGPDITIKSNVGGVAIVANWAVNPAEWGFLPDGNIELPNGTRIRDIGSYVSNTSGLELGNHGFRLDFGSPTNDWAIMSGARLIQVQPDEIFNISFAEQANWQFANTGNITFPDGTIQSTAIPNKITSNTANLIINGLGPEPYVLFPAASTGGQLQISEAELSSIAGNLALTSVQDAFVISNGDGSVPGGSKLWKFDRTGNLVLPQTAMDVSPAPVSWPGITFSDGTFQNTAYTGGGAAGTVDITNTNGLTTTYYPTFVESRTSGQYMRADVDLTYRTDDNLLRAGNIQVGRNIYGSAFYGISTAIQLRPNIDIDKRFLFTVDSSGGNYIRSGMEMPMAEVDKAVTLAFPHDNSTAGYIFNQGTDTNGTEWNDALVIFQNGGNVKIGTITGVNGNKVWEFNQTGNLTLPQTAMDVSPAPVSWPGITFSDGTFQNTAYTGGGGAASTVDITNTNGLTTTYYPTFVESRTNGQYMRADVDLTYRTDTNTLTAGNMATGVLKIEDGVHEKFQTKSNATGTVTHDCSSGHIFYHTLPNANWTVNLTNLNLAVGYATAITLVIEQGATGYYPSAVQIDGNAVPLAWQGNIIPTPSSNRFDVVTFSILYDGLHTVLGQLTGF
jgi:hypothetical protein